ncbi:MAG: hypothetical protein V3U71_02985 [Cocleimonas sp.]
MGTFVLGVLVGWLAEWLFFNFWVKDGPKDSGTMMKVVEAKTDEVRKLKQELKDLKASNDNSVENKVAAKTVGKSTKLAPKKKPTVAKTTKAAPAKKASVKKTTTKKAPAKKPAAKKVPTKKAITKATAKKAPAKKTTATKPVQKKTAQKKS